jgi:hypothetical protein
MRKPHGIARTCILAGAFALLTFRPAAAAPVASQPVLAAYSGRSLAFEPNRGQADPAVAFLARGAGFGLALSPTAAVLEFGPRRAAHRASPPAGTSAHTIRMDVLGADPAARATGEGKLAGESNYLVGAPARWRTHVPTYARVHFAGVYPGVDLVYYGNGGRLEHDFVVAPGADPGAIRLAVAGADRAELDPAGDLVLRWGDGEIRLRKPAAYQEIDGQRREVASAYRLLAGAGADGRRVGFALASYDRSRPLVIDPLLVYSTYLGGSYEDDGLAIAVDACGDAYVAGLTQSPDFPGSGKQPTVDNYDAFVTKLDPSGALVYSTVFGGAGGEAADGIAVDEAGAAYVTGSTFSADFPRVHPLPAADEGPAYPYDAFVTKLDPSGAGFVYSTRLGGAGQDGGSDIVVDAQGRAYIVGDTESPSFPLAGTPAHPIGADKADAFVAELSASGSTLLFARLLGGSAADYGAGIALDGTGGLYLSGTTYSTDFPTLHAAQTVSGGGFDAFVARLDASGALVFSTYLGGSGRDYGGRMAADRHGNGYLIGYTDSPNFTTVHPLQAALSGPSDDFVTEVDPLGAILYSTYLGGRGNEMQGGIDVDSTGSIIVSGTTGSDDFPVASPVQSECLPRFGGHDCAFVAELDHAGAALAFSTYIGGSVDDVATDVAVDPAGNLYVPGITGSPDFPTAHAVQPAYGGAFDAFVAKIAFDRPPDCSRAIASPATLWPPNGRLVPISILGVTDPEGGPLTLAVTGVTQDEPTGGAPDASGMGSATAFVRAERAGGGDGRVYHVQFTATDAAGLSCTGSVSVCVPHDAAHRTCGDGGALYGSTGG